jgi:hypothetical protein
MGFADEDHRIIRSSTATCPTFSVRPACWLRRNSASSASTGSSPYGVHHDRSGRPPSPPLASSLTAKTW